MTKRFVRNTNPTNRPKRQAPRQPISSDFEMMHPMPEKRPYMMYESAQVFREMDIYISDEFADPIQYCEMIHVIRSASPNDTIRIHLNTPGGRLDTGVQLISAIRSTEAKIVTILDGVAHSMGALLFLCGHEMIVHDHGQLMFHTYSGGVMGKGSDIRGQTDATEDWYRVIANDICHPFMTRREIQRMLKGEDFWFSTKDVEARLEKMFETLQKEHIAAHQAREQDQLEEMAQILEEAGYVVLTQAELDDEDEGDDIDPMEVEGWEVEEPEQPEKPVQPKKAKKNKAARVTITEKDVTIVSEDEVKLTTVQDV